MCVCVCVCERERERGCKEGEREIETSVDMIRLEFIKKERNE